MNKTILLITSMVLMIVCSMVVSASTIIGDDRFVLPSRYDYPSNFVLKDVQDCQNLGNLLPPITCLACYWKVSPDTQGQDTASIHQYNLETYGNDNRDSWVSRQVTDKYGDQYTVNENICWQFPNSYDGYMDETMFSKADMMTSDLIRTMKGKEYTYDYRTPSIVLTGYSNGLLYGIIPAHTEYVIQATKGTYDKTTKSRSDSIKIVKQVIDYGWV